MEAINKGEIGSHSATEGKTVLLLEYLSTFEPSTERIMKVQHFLDSLKIGPVGTMAQEEYFEEQVEKERLRPDSIMRDTMGTDPFDDESLANLEIQN